MSEYHKIQSMFFRDIETKNKRFLEGQWSQSEFEYLANNLWLFEEKIDGTNIRVSFVDNTIRFDGRTDNAQIPAHLYAKLQELFYFDILAKAFPEGNVVLYGEGYGAKIQKGGGDYIPEGVGFILFDVKIANWWLKREDVLEISQKLNIPMAPFVGTGTLYDAVDLCKKGFESQLRKTPPEGLVIRPAIDLFARNGQRIITKLKLKDFEGEK